MQAGLADANRRKPRLSLPGAFKHDRLFRLALHGGGHRGPRSCCRAAASSCQPAGRARDASAGGARPSRCTAGRDVPYFDRASPTCRCCAWGASWASPIWRSTGGFKAGQAESTRGGCSAARRYFPCLRQLTTCDWRHRRGRLVVRRRQAEAGSVPLHRAPRKELLTRRWTGSARRTGEPALHPCRRRNSAPTARGRAREHSRAELFWGPVAAPQARSHRECGRDPRGVPDRVRTSHYSPELPRGSRQVHCPSGSASRARAVFVESATRTWPVYRAIHTAFAAAGRPR
jgi:hypothetical protein